MTAWPALSDVQEVEQRRARMASDLDAIYRLAGFAVAVEAHQGVMRALVERAKAEGADTAGWIG